MPAHHQQLFIRQIMLKGSYLTLNECGHKKSKPHWSNGGFISKTNVSPTRVNHVNVAMVCTPSLLKESIIFLNEDVHPNYTESSEMENSKAKLNELSSDFECCTLDHDAKHVAAVVAGYAAKKIIKRSQCEQTLTAINPQNSFKEFEYLSKIYSSFSGLGSICF